MLNNYLLTKWSSHEHLNHSNGYPSLQSNASQSLYKNSMTLTNSFLLLCFTWPRGHHSDETFKCLNFFVFLPPWGTCLHPPHSPTSWVLLTKFRTFILLSHIFLQYASFNNRCLTHITIPRKHSSSF